MRGETEPREWPLEGEALFVDDNVSVRDAIVTQLCDAGCVCHTAASYAEGLPIFSKNKGIQVVILDHGIGGESLDTVVERIRSTRPETILIGTSGGNRREEFEAAGVAKYLPKPWKAADLLNLLPERLGDCIDCGLPLPLLRPWFGQRGESWVCCGCGGRYRGVLDASAPGRPS